MTGLTLYNHYAIIQKRVHHLVYSIKIRRESNMEELRKTTILFLIEKDMDGGVARVLLAMKKRGFGEGRWNGVGGKVADKIEEAVEEAAVREAKEEIGVDIETDDLQKVAELTFVFPHRPEWSDILHVFFVENWSGDPVETEEMRPQWYDVKDVPYAEMWDSDKMWLPPVLNGDKVKATFEFDESDGVTSADVNVVQDI